MNEPSFNRYSGIPCNEVVSSVQGWMQTVCDKTPTDLYVPSAGYALRTYAGAVQVARMQLNDNAILDLLPDLSRDALLTVGFACLQLLKVSTEFDKEPLCKKPRSFGITQDDMQSSVRELKADAALNGICAAQMGLEAATNNPDTGMMQYIIDDELIRLSGQSDPSVPYRQMYGTSMATRQAVIDTVGVAAQQFADFWGGIEVILPEGYARERVAGYVAGIAEATWSNPAWQQPPAVDYL